MKENGRKQKNINKTRMCFKKAKKNHKIKDKESKLNKIKENEIK